MHYEAVMHSPHGIAMCRLSGNYAFNHCIVTSEGVEFFLG